MRRPPVLVLVPMLAALVVAAVAGPASASSFSTAPRVKERAVPSSQLVALRTGRIVVDVAHPAQAGGATGTAVSGAQDGAGQPAVTTQPAGTGSPTAGELPFTGLPLLAVLAVGVSLTGVGLALIAAQRRRQTQSTGA